MHGKVILKRPPAISNHAWKGIHLFQRRKDVESPCRQPGEMTTGLMAVIQDAVAVHAPSHCHRFDSSLRGVFRLVAAHPHHRASSVVTLGNQKANVETPRLPYPFYSIHPKKCQWKIPNILFWSFRRCAIIFSLLKRGTGGCQEKLVCQNTYQIVAPQFICLCTPRYTRILRYA